MTWNLFIDDERYPKDVTWFGGAMRKKYLNEEWQIARSKIEVAELIAKNGCLPSFISFDHDLGECTANGYDIMRWLVSIDIGDLPCAYGRFPDDFDFHVHSMNPIGAKNIHMYLYQYLRKREK